MIHGHPFTHRQPRIHRYVADWPERYVVDGRVLDKGWNPCQLCGRWHRSWITDDAVWKTLPTRNAR